MYETKAWMHWERFFGCCCYEKHFLDRNTCPTAGEIINILSYSQLHRVNHKSTWEHDHHPRWWIGRRQPCSGSGSGNTLKCSPPHPILNEVLKCFISHLPCTLFRENSIRTYKIQTLIEVMVFNRTTKLLISW